MTRHHAHRPRLSPSARIALTALAELLALALLLVALMALTMTVGVALDGPPTPAPVGTVAP